MLSLLIFKRLRVCNVLELKIPLSRKTSVQPSIMARLGRRAINLLCLLHPKCGQLKMLKLIKLLESAADEGLPVLKKVVV
jgi:hypothetical protein